MHVLSHKVYRLCIEVSHTARIAVFEVQRTAFDRSIYNGLACERVECLREHLTSFRRSIRGHDCN